MTNTNQISLDSCAQFPYSRKDWSEYLETRSDAIKLISLAEIIPLGVLTAISAVLAYVLVRILSSYQGMAVFMLLAVAVPVFGLISTVFMIVGFSKKNLRKVIWMAGFPLLLILGVCGFAWLFFNFAVIGLGESDRATLESVNQQYTGKEITLAYDGAEYQWNGALAGGYLDDLSMKMELNQELSGGDTGVLSLVFSDRVPVMIDGAEEEYLLFQNSDSQDLYVKVCSNEIDLFLKLEKVQ